MLTLILVISIGLGVETSSWWAIWTIVMDLLIYDALRNNMGNRVLNLNIDGKKAARNDNNTSHH